MRKTASALLLLSLFATSCAAPTEGPSSQGLPPASPAAPGAPWSSGGETSTEPPAETPEAPAPEKPAEPVPPPTLPSTYQVETMTFNGVPREVGLSVPTAPAPSAGVALVIALHGDGGTGPGLRAALDIDAVANGAAVVAYPSSLKWGWDLTLPAEANKDIPWIEALVASLSSLHPIDPSRIFAVGYSKGAFFANQLACTRSGLLRGVAIHAGGAPYDPNGAVGRYPNGYVQCDVAQTGTAALVVHGEADYTVPFGSGKHATDYWAYVNGCGGDEVASSMTPCVSRVGCPTALPVTFCPVPGLDHGLWSRAAEVSWTFFAGL